jgi:hypothetical protein
MPFVHGKDTYFKVASTDLSTYINSVSVSRTADTAETSAFGSSTKSFVSGLRDATITVSGMFDAAVYSTIAGWLGTSQTWEYGPAGSASGRVKVSGSGIVTSVELSSSVGEVVAANISIQVSGTVTDGTFSA